MNKSTTITIILGVAIVITTVIMIIRLGLVAKEFSMHPEWSLSVVGAVQVTAMFYGIIMFILTMFLVLVNVLKSYNKK